METLTLKKVIFLNGTTYVNWFEFLQIAGQFVSLLELELLLFDSFLLYNQIAHQDVKAL